MLLTRATRFTLGAVCLAVAVLAVSCATIDKTLDEVDKGLEKAEETVERVENTIDKVDNTVSRVAKTANRVENKTKELGSRVENIVKTKRHLVAKGDTLWGLASRLYRNSDARIPGGQGGYLWPLICEQNGISNCHVIEIGDIIRYLPADRLSTVNNTDLRRHLQVAFDAP